MIDVVEWTRVHRSQLAAWPIDKDVLLPYFLLKAAWEPYEVTPTSLAIVSGSALVGRFSYRLLPNSSAFVGLVINPDFRGRKLGRYSLRAALLHLFSLGVTKAVASVAVANIASMIVFGSAGFETNAYDIRPLPYDFDVFLLSKLPSTSYVATPSLSLIYASMSLSLSRDMFADEVQEQYTGLVRQRS